MSVAKNLGRHLFGLAAIGFGIIACTWHDFDEWQQLHSLWGIPAGPALVYVAATLEIMGGIAVQARKTTRLGAALLCIVYAFFAARWIPSIIAAPLSYGGWGNPLRATLPGGRGADHLRLGNGRGRVGLQGSPGSATTSSASASSPLRSSSLFIWTARPGSFQSGLRQARCSGRWRQRLLSGLAAVALLTRYLALAASRLLTLMFVLFGCSSGCRDFSAIPIRHINWGGNAQNFAIAAAAWIVADFLDRNRAAMR